jgi:predicted RNase H-like nuclease (RuvC/YqgF family)
LDPGTTIGIAILDLHGKVVELTSKREAKKSDVIKHILKFGKPLIVASDVNPMPKKIERVASALGSRTFYPEVSLTNLEKEKIVRDFEDEVKNSHQKDALAAAIKAFRSYHELFIRVEKSLGDRKELYDDVTRIVLKKRSYSISDVIKSLVKKK